jgi:hypothetical protein
MAESLTLQGRQTLPMPFNDRSLNTLILDRCLEETPPLDRYFLLHEARRILEPGGVLEFTGPLGEQVAQLRQMASELGLDPVEPRHAELGSVSTLSFRKPNRTVHGLPLVSITIPAYSARFFEQALASAVEQGYPNLQIIVCDDSEGTEIEQITRRMDPARRIRYERNTTRLRGRGNYAKCFELAQGEFIKYLNDDDVLMPDCVERMVEAFRSVPDCTLATSYRPRIDEAGARIPDQPATRPLAAEDMIITGASLANVMILAGLNIVGEPTTTLFRKADLQRAIPGSFQFSSERNIGMIDMALWSALLLQGDTVYFADGLSLFRIHGGQQQQQPHNRGAAIANIRHLQSEWLGKGIHARLQWDAFISRPLANASGPWRSHPYTPVSQPPAARFWRFV